MHKCAQVPWLQQIDPYNLKPFCRRNERIRMSCIVCHLLDRLQKDKHQTGKTEGQERTEQTNQKDGKAQ